MTDAHRVRWGMWNLLPAAIPALVLAVVLAVPFSSGLTGLGAAPQSGPSAVHMAPALAGLATDQPTKRVEVIVQLDPGTDVSQGRKLVRAAGGRVTGELPIIGGLAARMSAASAGELGGRPGVKAVSLNGAVKPQAVVNFDPNKMSTSFNQSVKASNVWGNASGKGVGVAVIDTGIDGDLVDFRTSQTNSASRVIGSVVTNPAATGPGDSYGHGTHVAGLIAGNSGYRPNTDKLRGKYAGSAPDANLISVKASDELGNSTVLDVIYGLQFVIDHKDTYNIRVVNLSLESTVAESYKTDPLDAAVEAAWFQGIVVVAAAGNRGSDSDAVKYAPGNDPYVISVGAVDDKATKDINDDVRADWSSRGQTQDGFAKPDFYAPGAHIVSNLAPGSAFDALCPSCERENGQYIQAGGTSMAAPIIAGVVASILEDRPTWTPDQVKGALVNTLRTLPGGGKEPDSLAAYGASKAKLVSNQGLTPNTLINPDAGAIDYTRSSWSRSRWSTASGSMSADWARSSWSCNCSLTTTGEVDPTRSRWSRSRWSTSWSL
jgi:serine protease AprX